MKWRKPPSWAGQPSPKSGKQALKGLTLFLKSHISGAAGSLHSCPWGSHLNVLLHLCLFLLDGECCKWEMQDQHWVRILGEACLLDSLCCRQRLSQLGKQSRAQGRFAFEAEAQLLLPSPQAPQHWHILPRKPGAGGRAQSRLLLPLAARSDCAEHGPCGTPGAQRSTIGFVPSSTAVSHPNVGGREAEEAGEGYY